MLKRIHGAIAGAALVLSASAAQAHPHVFVTAKSEIVYAADGTITGVRHAWSFDDSFSAYATQGLDQKTKGVFTREELADLAKTNVESLKEYDFFTEAKSAGGKERFVDPVEYYLDYKDSVLTLHFMLPFKKPVSSKTLTLEIFDPTYFVDFTFAQKDPVSLAGAPASCKLDLARPAQNNAASQKLSEQSFLNGSNPNFGANFATKVSVNC
jgi:ABC-type uncharacterized transport system substrate-binding protein